MIKCSMIWYRCCGSLCIAAWRDYEDTNDALRLARDPAMQAVVGRRALEKQAASSLGPATSANWKTICCGYHGYSDWDDLDKRGVSGPSLGIPAQSAIR